MLDRSRHHVPMTGVGTLNEKSLHAQLKAWYAAPGDRFEVRVGTRIVDIVRDDLLIEIQTRHLSAMKQKLLALLEDRHVRVVFPIAATKQLVKLGEGGEVLDRRRSPKRGSVLEIFAELVGIPTLVDHRGFALHVLLIDEEELREFRPEGNWRRKGWRTVERRLKGVQQELTIASKADLVALLPALPDRWTTADVAAATGTSRRLSQQIAYTLRKSGAAVPLGKDGNTVVYTLA